MRVASLQGARFVLCSLGGGSGGVLVERVGAVVEHPSAKVP